MIQHNNFYVENTGIEFINYFIQSSNIFSLIFICLCFLFMVNGANLVDGYNGLLGIHSLIILVNLFLINSSIPTEGYVVGTTTNGIFPFHDSENSKISSGVSFFE